jgi:hypothetical protein
MPHPIPSSPPQEATAVAPQLVSPAPETPDATDIVADAYNAVMSDPAVRTSHDAASYILDALDAAGFAVVLRGLENAEVRS